MPILEPNPHLANRLNLAAHVNAMLAGWPTGAPMFDKMPGDCGLHPGTRPSHINGPTFRASGRHTGQEMSVDHRGHSITPLFHGMAQAGHRLYRAEIRPPRGETWMCELAASSETAAMELAVSEIDRKLDEQEPERWDGLG